MNNVRHNSKGKLTIELDSLVFMALSIAYKICFELFYISGFSRLYSYAGSYYSPNYEKRFVSWIVIVLFLFANCILKRNNILTLVFRIMMLISIIPTVSLFWLKDESTNAFLLLLLYWIIWYISTLIIGKKFKSYLEYKGDFCLSSNNRVITLVFAWIIISTIYFSWKYGDFRLFIRFADVYQFRLDDSTRMTTIGGYIFRWNWEVLMPLCAISFLHWKKRIRVVIIALMYLLSYSIAGEKTIFFSLIVIIAFAVLEKQGKLNRINNYLVLGLDALLIILLNFYHSLPIMFTALLYRLICIPSEAHYYYYDFFSHNEFLYLRQSILRFLPSGYDRPVSMIIGSSSAYYAGGYQNANNGLFSDAFQNFGSIGVVFYPIIIVTTIAMIAWFIRMYTDFYKYTIITISCIYLYSAYYFSWLLTGGMIVTVLIYYFAYYGAIKKGKCKIMEGL